MPSRHALLGASSAHRWLECTPSARATEHLPDHESEAAAEGTLAHAWAEYFLRELNGEDAYDPHEGNAEMREYAIDYAQYVYGALQSARKVCPSARLVVEQELDFSDWVPEAFGTADAVIIAEPTLSVFDFKYGKGVKVDATDNPQMKLYALGALALYEQLYDVRQISMTIYQPRIDNLSSFSLDTASLRDWGRDVVQPRAEQAWRGEGVKRSGSWCRFCKLAATCATRAAEVQEATRHQFTPQDELSDDDIAEILAAAPELKRWLSDVEGYALEKALAGKHWPGFKLVEGRSSRRYTDEHEVLVRAKTLGFRDVTQIRPKTITALEKQIGKTTFAKTFGDLVTKPAGKPSLVSTKDKRPEIQSVKDALESATKEME